MLGSRWNSIASIVMLASLGSASFALGQNYVMRRLPPVVQTATPIPSFGFSQAVPASAYQVVGRGERVRWDEVIEDPLASYDPPAESLPHPALEPVAVLQEEFVGPGIWLPEYVIQPGDELEVKFRVTSDLNETVVVRPDGMITLQIIGDVMAASHTAEGLRQALMTAYAQSLKNPDLVVILRKPAGNHVYVGGEVLTPGRINIPGQITALQAIILAGGFKDTADKKRIILRRDDGYMEELNLKKEIHNGYVGYDVPLRPSDVIFVPKSRIAKVNQFVDQYIEKVLPFQRQFGIFISRDLSSQ